MIRPALTIAAALISGAALAAQPVTLKSAPSDTDGAVTLAEVFDGTASTVVVGSGPKPGATVVLDAAKVQAAARAAGFVWSNPAGVRRIVVRSAAPVVTVAAEKAPTGAAEALTYARSLNAGSVVSADDLTWAAVARMPADAPEDAEAVIGLALKKPVRSGAAVSARDLTAARVIAKNDAVSVLYRNGRISLALQGKALTAAAVGEPIRVLNTQSKTVIEAVAAAPGLALVGPQADALKLRGPAALAIR